MLMIKLVYWAPLSDVHFEHLPQAASKEADSMKKELVSDTKPS
jgi:hypothetical protein